MFAQGGCVVLFCATAAGQAEPRERRGVRQPTAAASLQWAVGFLGQKGDPEKRGGESRKHFLSEQDSWLMSSPDMQL